MSDDITRILQQLLTDGAYLGGASWALTAVVIYAYTKLLKQPDPSNDWKRALGVGLPVAIVVVAYVLGVATGYIPRQDDLLYNAIKIAVGLGVGKAVFAVTKAAHNGLPAPGVTQSPTPPTEP